MLLCEYRGRPAKREFEYRIKSASEEHERVPLESELTRHSGDPPVATRARPLVRLTCAVAADSAPHAQFGRVDGEVLLHD
jgi:hypothetical protein